MLFNSVQFFVFLIAVLIVYFATKPKYRWIVLLVSSIYFYISLKVEYAIIIAVSIIINYYLGIYLAKMQDSKKKKLLLIFAIIFNLLLLLGFKYLNFLDDSLRLFLSAFSIKFYWFIPKIIFPIGISFYTLQNLSYIIDIYNQRINPEKNIFHFSLYALFFPKFISGPIERPANFIPQIKQEHKFDYPSFISGGKRIIIGLIKKMIVADRLALIVTSVYGSPYDYSGFSLIFATLAFSFQLYFDFSGYTDIALGISRIMGYQLTENFRRPYLAKNVSEFWKRWHISLSSWFQDYVFVPIYLAVSKIKCFAKLKIKTKHVAAFIISILIGDVLLGLWHGANWTFVAFGLYFGAMISIYYLGREYFDALNRYAQIVLTFALVSFSWIFFRANSIKQSFYIISHSLPLDLRGFFSSIINTGFGLLKIDFLILSIPLVLLLLLDLIQEKNESSINNFLHKLPRFIRVTIYILLILYLILFGIFGATQFMYAKF